ncbi:MAG: PaaI family thioesterase [Leptospira sp.]|nr:PaaI family thioesterase [Leptospira sp.]
MIEFEKLTTYKKVPNQENGTCFACGQNHSTGLHMKFYTDETSVFSELNLPHTFAGWSRLIHGGVTATILDETLAWTVIYLRQSFILTKSLTIDYLRPLFVEEDIFSIGNILSQVSDKELLVEATILNSKKEICAKASGKIVMFSAEQMRKKDLFPREFLEHFESSVFGK